MIEWTLLFAKAIRLLVAPFVGVFDILMFLVVAPLMFFTDTIMFDGIFLPVKVAKKFLHFKPKLVEVSTLLELTKVLYHFFAVAVLFGIAAGVINCVAMHGVRKLLRFKDVDFTVPLIDLPVSVKGETISMDEQVAARSLERKREVERAKLQKIAREKAIQARKKLDVARQRAYEKADATKQELYKKAESARRDAYNKAVSAGKKAVKTASKKAEDVKEDATDKVDGKLTVTEKDRNILRKVGISEQEINILLPLGDSPALAHEPKPETPAVVSTAPVLPARPEDKSSASTTPTGTVTSTDVATPAAVATPKTPKRDAEIDLDLEITAVKVQTDQGKEFAVVASLDEDESAATTSSEWHQVQSRNAKKRQQKKVSSPEHSTPKAKSSTSYSEPSSPESVASIEPDQSTQPSTIRTEDQQK